MAEEFAACIFAEHRLTMNDNGEVVLYAEPDTTLILQLQSVASSPFAPEQEL